MPQTPMRCSSSSFKVVVGLKMFLEDCGTLFPISRSITPPQKVRWPVEINGLLLSDASGQKGSNKLEPKIRTPLDHYSSPG